MSSTNKTSNLELSQFIGTDSPKWLTDYNSDMQKIDAGVAAVQTQANATDLVVSGHTSSIQANTQSIGDQQTAITSLRTDVTAAQGSINTINSLIGNGEPTTTDKTIIGAINELAAEMPSPTTQLPATSVSYSNTTSGLTASTVQAAIDELAQGAGGSAASSITYSNTASGLAATNVQSAIDELATSSQLKIGLIVRGYGDSNSYSGRIACEQYGVSFSDVAYRQNTIITLDDVTLNLTMPSAASGGSLVITMSGTHSIKVKHNSLNVSPTATFTDTYTISDWSSDGLLVLEID